MFARLPAIMGVTVENWGKDAAPTPNLLREDVTETLVPDHCAFYVLEISSSHLFRLQCFRDIFHSPRPFYNVVVRSYDSTSMSTL